MLFGRCIADTPGGDPRIVMLDLFNEQGHTNRGEITLPHLKQLFVEARRQEMLQPVTSCVWRRMGNWTVAEKYALEVSDVVSFHNYNCYDCNIQEIAELRKLGRQPVEYTLESLDALK